jgi:hypothetical protein
VSRHFPANQGRRLVVRDGRVIAEAICRRGIGARPLLGLLTRVGDQCDDRYSRSRAW